MRAGVAKALGMRLGLMGLASAALGCSFPFSTLPASQLNLGQAVALGLPRAASLGPSLPAALLEGALPVVQAAADEASRRRDIDFFRLQKQGVGLRWTPPSGREVWVLGLVGVSRERTEVSIEATALVADGASPASVFSYGGPVAWQGATRSPALGEKAVGARKSPSAESWNLMQGLPPSQVLNAYGDRLEELARWLPSRFGARPFAWDEVPLCFVLEAGDGQPLAFALANHRNRLVLGERKAADVRHLALLSPQGQWLGSATLVGWDAKLPKPEAEVVFDKLTAPSGEAVFTWGEAP